MIEIKDMPNAYRHLTTDGDFMLQTYGERLTKAFNEIYDYLVNETDMVKFLRCELNSEENLFDMFLEYVDNYYTKYALEEGMFALYNVLNNDGRTFTEPIPFKDLWKRDMYNYMSEKYRKVA